MAKETPEEKKARLKAQLARGRETAKANRAAKAQQVARGSDEELLRRPMPTAPIAEEDDTVEVERIEGDEIAIEALEARRARLLEGVDPAIADLISDDELDQIEEEERIKAEAERKKLALQTVRESLRQKARVENDLIASSVLLSEAEKKRRNEPVTFRVNLPMDGAGDPAKSAHGLKVDHFRYQQGQTYTRPRAVFESLQEAHYRIHLQEIAFKTLDQHKRGNSAPEIIARNPPPFEVIA